MHNMNFSLILIPALGPIVSFVEIAKKLAQGSERHYLQRFPRWRQIGIVVFAKVVFDKILFGTRYFALYLGEAFDILFDVVLEKAVVHKPERAVFHREVLDNASPQRNLDCLDCREYYTSQFFVEIV